MVQIRQPGQNASSVRRQFDMHHSAILGCGVFGHQSSPARPLDQTDHGIVPLLQKLGEIRNRRPISSRETGNPEHQLMLLRRNAGAARRALTESEEFAKLVTKPCQLPHSRTLGRRPRPDPVFLGRHASLISHCDIIDDGCLPLVAKKSIEWIT
jgi:hypothetical protein